MPLLISSSSSLLKVSSYLLSPSEPSFPCGKNQNLVRRNWSKEQHAFVGSIQLGITSDRTPSESSCVGIKTQAAIFVLYKSLVFFLDDIDSEFLAYDENSKCNEGHTTISSNYGSLSHSSFPHGSS